MKGDAKSIRDVRQSELASSDDVWKRQINDCNSDAGWICSTIPVKNNPLSTTDYELSWQ